MTLEEMFESDLRRRKRMIKDLAENEDPVHVPNDEIEWLLEVLYHDLNEKVWRSRETKEVMWIPKDGEPKRLQDMETTHLRNCIAQIFLRANGWRTGYLTFLAEELKKRTD